MFIYLKTKKQSFTFSAVSRILVLTLSTSLTFAPVASYAQVLPQTIFNLPAVGTMVPLSAGFTPTIIKGMTIFPDNPLNFDFILDTGDENLEGEAFEQESKKLIKYFLASLTVPEEDQWVNLSPYEKDRIVPESLSLTEMGRDMLAQDYLLKQISASLMYPEDEIGQEFWDRVYTKAQEQFGNNPDTCLQLGRDPDCNVGAEIPMNTFNKIWIVPSKATLYEKDGNVFILENHLKVMLEEDYVALQEGLKVEKFGLNSRADDNSEIISGVTSQVVREVLIPEIEREVNEGKNFAQLRQIYNSMLLATWYKRNLKDSLLGQIYVDQNKMKGIDDVGAQDKEKIYNQYVEAFKTGVYNYIREDYDAKTDEIIPRKYFSGGATSYENRSASPIIMANSPVREDLAGVSRVARVRLDGVQNGKIVQLNVGDDSDRLVSSPVREAETREITANLNMGVSTDGKSFLNRVYKFLVGFSPKDKEWVKDGMNLKWNSLKKTFSLTSSSHGYSFYIRQSRDEFIAKNYWGEIARFPGRNVVGLDYRAGEKVLYIIFRDGSDAAKEINEEADGDVDLSRIDSSDNLSWSMGYSGQAGSIDLISESRYKQIKGKRKKTSISLSFSTKSNESEDSAASPIGPYEKDRADALKGIEKAKEGIAYYGGFIKKHGEGNNRWESMLAMYKGDLVRAEAGLEKANEILENSDRQILINNMIFDKQKYDKALTHIVNILRYKGIAEVYVEAENKFEHMLQKKKKRKIVVLRMEEDSLGLDLRRTVDAVIDEIAKKFNVSIFESAWIDQTGFIDDVSDQWPSQTGYVGVRYPLASTKLNTDSNLEELRENIIKYVEKLSIAEKDASAASPVTKYFGKRDAQWVGATITESMLESFKEGKSIEVPVEFLNVKKLIIDMSSITHMFVEGDGGTAGYNVSSLGGLKEFIKKVELSEENLVGKNIRLRVTGWEEIPSRTTAASPVTDSQLAEFYMPEANALRIALKGINQKGVSLFLVKEEILNILANDFRRSQWTDGLNQYADYGEDKYGDEWASALRSFSDKISWAIGQKKGPKEIENEINKAIVALDKSVSSPVGGINLNPAPLDMDIKRDADWTPIQINTQQILNMNIEGFVPVILNVAPVNIPLLLGLTDEEDSSELSLNTLADPFDKEDIFYIKDPEDTGIC